MIETFNRTGAVTGRVLNQLRQDRRLIVLSLMIPLVVIYFFKVLFDVLANPLFDISVYVVPYGAFIVHFITLVLTAIVLVRERTAETLPRMFVSGYNQVEIIGGYLLAYTVLATVQSLLILFELNGLFELGYEPGRLASLYLIMWMLAVISMALGMLISNFARNEGQVFPFIPLVILSAIVSGIIIPFEKLPAWSQVLSYMSPLFYANEVLQELIAGGKLLDDLKMLLGLPAYGLVVMAMVTLTLREKD